MADNSKIGTILIVAVICVGILLVVSSGIAAWQNYQNIADADDDVPKIPAATGGVTIPPSASATTVSPAPAESRPSPSSPTETASPVLSATAAATTTTPAQTPLTQAPSQPQATASAVPTRAPAADDPVLGTWTGTKSISLLFVSANGEGTVTFRDDYTGDVSGEVRGAGMDEVFASGFVWTNNGGGRYTGTIGTESMTFTLAGETLTMTINPKKLGLNAVLDMDIPVEMHRI